MEDNTRQLIEVLVALSPYVLFVAMIIWAAVAELVDGRQRARIASKRATQKRHAPTDASKQPGTQ